MGGWAREGEYPKSIHMHRGGREGGREEGGSLKYSCLAEEFEIKEVLVNTSNCCVGESQEFNPNMSALGGVHWNQPQGLH